MNDRDKAWEAYCDALDGIKESQDTLQSLQAGIGFLMKIILQRAQEIVTKREGSIANDAFWQFIFGEGIGTAVYNVLQDIENGGTGEGQRLILNPAQDGSLLTPESIEAAEFLPDEVSISWAFKEAASHLHIFDLQEALEMVHTFAQLIETFQRGLDVFEGESEFDLQLLGIAIFGPDGVPKQTGEDEEE